MSKGLIHFLVMDGVQMPQAVTYALLSLVFASVHDVVFKRYAAKDRSRGTYIFGIGLVWLLLQVPTALTRGADFPMATVTLGWGLLAGETIQADEDRLPVSARLSTDSTPWV